MSSENMNMQVEIEIKKCFLSGKPEGVFLLKTIFVMKPTCIVNVLNFFTFLIEVKKQVL